MLVLPSLSQCILFMFDVHWPLLYIRIHFIFYVNGKSVCLAYYPDAFRFFQSRILVKKHFVRCSLQQLSLSSVYWFGVFQCFDKRNTLRSTRNEVHHREYTQLGRRYHNNWVNRNIISHKNTSRYVTRDLFYRCLLINLLSDFFFAAVQMCSQQLTDTWNMYKKKKEDRIH